MTSMSSGLPAPVPLSLRGNPIPAGLDEALIRRVVFGFYDRVRRDDVLGPIFNTRIAAGAWPSHLEKMCDFWSSVLLKTDRYAGRPLLPHLAMDEIAEDTFDRWLSLFDQTVETECDRASAALFSNFALRISRSFRMALAFHRGQSDPDLPQLARAPRRRDRAAGREAVSSADDAALAPAGEPRQ
jgi:hemoglobin